MWADLSLETLAIVWLGGFLGGIATGAAGFAYGVVASSIWLHAIAPVHVTILVVSIGLIIQAGLTWKMRRSLDMQRLSPFVIAGLAGVPIGVWLVIKTNPGAIKVALAAFMVAYGIYALAAPRLPRVIGGGMPADAAVGFVGGILGGLSGLSGILPAIWTQIRGWPKDVARGIFQPFIVVMHVATVILIGAVALDRTGVVLFVVVFPSVLLGAWVGWMIYGKLDERSFQRMFAGLLVVSGVLLMTCAEGMNVSIERYLAYLLACFVITIIPGPTVTLIVANSLAHGARAGLLNVVGTQFGLGLMMLVLAVGLTSIIATMGVWFDWLRLIGAAYLIWLGWKLLRANGGLDAPGAAPAPRAGFVLQGFLVLLGNPKALLWFGAFIPQFVDPTGNYVQQVILLGLTAMAAAAISDGAYAVLAGGAGRLMSKARVRLVSRIGGLCLIGGGVWLALARSR